MKSIYDFTVKDADLNDFSLEEYKNKILLVVNVASLQRLQQAVSYFYILLKKNHLNLHLLQ